MKYLIALLIITLSFYSHAKLYKWVDEEGNTHYGETPPDYKSAKTIAPPPPPNSSGLDLKSLRKEITKQAKDTKKSKEDAKQDADYKKKKATYCLQLRERITNYQNSPRVRKKNDSGEYYYANKQNEIKKLQSSLSEHCN